MKTYQDRFIEAVIMLQSRFGLPNLKDIAVELDINYMTLYKIMDRSNRPTVDHCVTILVRGGYDANWLFLGKGGKIASENTTLKEIKSSLTRIEATLHQFNGVNTSVNTLAGFSAKSKQFKK